MHTRRNGTVSFRLTLPGPGIVDVLETAGISDLAHATSLLQPASGRFVFARKHLTVHRAHAIGVIVTPDKRGRLLLAHHRHAVLIRLWVSYTPTSGNLRDIGLYGVRIAR